MIKYMFFVVGMAIVVCVLYSILERQTDNQVRDPRIPRFLTKADIWLDGSKVMYRYDGNWYEAVARTKNSILIHDIVHDKIVKVPFIEEDQ